MVKKLLSVLLLLGCFFSLALPTLASGFNLQSIGGVDTDGKLYDHWWYSGLQPAFLGEAPASSTVDISIDGTTQQTTADDLGNWSYTPSAPLSAGDHQVSLTNNESSLSFTLTLGTDNVDWQKVGSGSGEGQSLPTVGFIFPTLFFLTAGGGMILVSKKGFEK
jgi:hypothetical protein